MADSGLRNSCPSTATNSSFARLAASAEARAARSRASSALRSSSTCRQREPAVDDERLAAALEGGNRCLGGEEHRLEAHGHHTIPLMFRRVHQRLAGFDSDIVVRDVEPAPPPVTIAILPASRSPI